MLWFDIGILKENGIFITIASFEPGNDPYAHQPLKWCGKFGVSNNTKHQDELQQLIINKQLVIPIDEEFPFTTEGIQNLFSKIEKNKSIGKNILKLFDN